MARLAAVATVRPRGGDDKPANLAESVVNAAMRYRAQIPFVDNLLKEVGMTPNNLSNLSGLSVRLPDSKRGSAAAQRQGAPEAARKIAAKRRHPPYCSRQRECEA